MRSVLYSRKGIETSPLLFALSAIILVLTVALVFPTIMDMQKTMDQGRAIKEAVRLRDAINEVYAMGDKGTVEVIDLSVPPRYCIEVVAIESKLKIFKNQQTAEEIKVIDVKAPFEFNTNQQGDKPNHICSNARIVIAYEDKTKNLEPEEYQILIKG